MVGGGYSRCPDMVPPRWLSFKYFQEGAEDADAGPVEDAGGPQLEGPRGQLLSSIMMYS